MLKNSPSNIPVGKKTPFALAFKQNPKAFVFNNKIQSYRNYYLTKQCTIWTNREIPDWWTTDESVFLKYANDKQTQEYYNVR